MMPFTLVGAQGREGEERRGGRGGAATKGAMTRLFREGDSAGVPTVLVQLPAASAFNPKVS